MKKGSAAAKAWGEKMKAARAKKSGGKGKSKAKESKQKKGPHLRKGSAAAKSWGAKMAHHNKELLKEARARRAKGPKIPKKVLQARVERLKKLIASR
jgi:hypothetical protein